MMATAIGVPETTWLVPGAVGTWSSAGPEIWTEAVPESKSAGIHLVGRPGRHAQRDLVVRRQRMAVRASV